MVTDISWVTLDFENPGPLVNIEGLNDFGIVVNNTGNTLLSIVRNRLASIVNEQLLTPKINILVNKVLLLLPQDIHLKGDLYLEGLLYSNPQYTPAYMVAQVDSTLVNVTSPYPGSSAMTFPKANVTLDYQLTLQVSQYFLNSLFWAINDAVNITIPPNPKLTTSTLTKIVGSLKGFDSGMNCTTTLWTGHGQTPLNLALNSASTLLDI